MKHPALRHVGKRPCATDADLAQLLCCAVDGDREAFMSFYDATIQMVYGYARLQNDDAAAVDEAVRAHYARAWRSAAGHPGSGLSARAWLLVHEEPR